MRRLVRGENLVLLLLFGKLNVYWRCLYNQNTTGWLKQVNQGDVMKLSKILMSLIPILGLVCGCNLWQEEKQLPAPDCRKIEQQANVNTLSGKDPAAAWRTLDLKKYPDANTILLDELESVRYNCDGTYTRQDESWTLIVTENGRKQSRNISLHFNEFYQQIPDLLCEIVKPDGRVIKPVLQKNIITESSQMQSNIYDPSNKVLNVGIPDLEIGDIIHTL